MPDDVLLIVDDDPDLLELMVVLLEDAGYRVRTATNGQEALSAVADEMPRLILLDMKMPVMNGWQFAQVFRERHDHLAPIVVVTAAADAGARAREIGADAWLAKPFEIDDLQAVVARFLGPPPVQVA